MNRKTFLMQGRCVVLAACSLLIGAASLQSCKDDLLEGQPEWLGESIYEQLQNDPDGQHYSYLLRLIDDLGQTEVLSHTGSKTIFAADDEAFQRWFNTNNWGVRSYEQLSASQKNLLLNTAMISNAYLIELLSNASGETVVKGVNMRRSTALTIYDSVSVVRAKDLKDPEKGLPNTTAWQHLREAGKDVPLFKDATPGCLIHFLPDFMKQNDFTSEDILKLTNQKSNSVDVSWINGVQVTKENITCKNGYIHKVAEVVEPVFNMAQVMRNHPASMSQWSKLIDRFSAPYYVNSTSQEYNRLYNRNDSAYVMRYFSDLSAGQRSNAYFSDGVTPAKATLIFDPGWNQYMYKSDTKDMHYDAAALLVPRDEVLNAWWNSSALKARYGTWDNVPDGVLAELLNNFMIDNFVGTIPSKFEQIVDDSQVRMGIKPENVDSCFIGSNGVVYLINKMFPPSSFSSVAFPAMVGEDVLNIIYWAISQLNFKPFLNSMEATYSLILPTNDAMLTYIDPTMYGMKTNILYRFYYDPSASESERVKARRYMMKLNETTNQWECTGAIPGEVSQTIIKNRLKDLMNSLIIVGELDPNREYYKTRSGSTVRIKNIGQEGSMEIAGGYQLENHGGIVLLDGVEILNNQLPAIVHKIHDQRATAEKAGNGMSYEIGNCLPLSSTQTLFTLLKNNSDFSEFYNLLKSPDSKATLISTTSGTGDNTKYSNNDKGTDGGNVTLFESYNYTIYVPSNTVIQDLISRDYLPKWSDVTSMKKDDWTLPKPDGYDALSKVKKDSVDKVLDAKKDSLFEVAKNILRNRINDFVRYHIQDNALFINGEPVSNGRYESAKVNPENNRFYTVTVTAGQSNMSVTGQYVMNSDGSAAPCFDSSGNMIAGRSLNVNTSSGKYNMMIREFWNEGTTTKSGTVDPGSDTDQNKNIFTASDGVVHLLDGGALFFDPKQMTSWKDEIKNLKTKYGIL